LESEDTKQLNLLTKEVPKFLQQNPVHKSG